ncbi:MAG: GNAT family N-acetyltransferase [bacterium]|nr:GNAT family N-acetyltransferase [bacterium]
MIIRAAKESELEELIDLQELVFRPGEVGAKERYRSYVREDPTYQLDQSRLVFDKGRIVAQLRVWDRKVRVRGAMLRAGGIGSVLVHPEFRGRGYAQALMAETDPYFKAAGYDLGLLFSIMGTPFYAAQGWTPIPLPTFKFESGISVPHDIQGDVRTLNPEDDLPAVAGIYHSATVQMTGVEVRDESYWTTGPARYRRVFPPYGVFVQDQLVAYVNFDIDEPEVWVKEACALWGYEDTYGDLVCKVIDETGGLKPVTGSLPHNHPFIHHLCQVTGKIPEWHTHDEMMVKLVNWKTLTEKLGGIYVPVGPPEPESDFWKVLLGLTDASFCAPLRPWIGSLNPCGEVFYWWTDIF